MLHSINFNVWIWRFELQKDKLQGRAAYYDICFGLKRVRFVALVCFIQTSRICRLYFQREKWHASAADHATCFGLKRGRSETLIDFI